MSLLSTINISSTGLSVERLRMDLIAENIANIDTTRTREGGPYRRKVAVFKEKLQKEFKKNGNFFGAGVEVEKVVDDNSSPLIVYEPGHPDANAEGYVAKPNINLVNEIVDLIAASRAYEANVTVLNTTKVMALKTLSIGKG